MLLIIFILLIIKIQLAINIEKLVFQTLGVVASATEHSSIWARSSLRHLVIERIDASLIFGQDL